MAIQAVLLGGTKMAVEIIGEAGTAGADREWIEAESQLAIRHLAQLDQLQAIFGVLAVISAVKSRVSIAAL